MAAPPSVDPDQQASPVASPINSATSRIALAELLGLRLQTLTWVLYGRGTDSYYRSWVIKKRYGGTRQIKAPNSTLYRIQKGLNEILQQSYRPRPAAHGFIKDRSVATNARPHVGHRYVLNVDIENFFPSIHFGRVRGLFLARPFNCQPEVATLLAKICCTGDALPIGAPTSPVVSNMICIRMDRELQNLAKAHGCWYTRYADDMTFSSGRRAFPASVAHSDDQGEIVLGDDLVRILSTNGFAPNHKKTRLQTRSDRQLVTGLVVNEKLNVDRRYVRRIRAMLHAWNVHGLANAESHVATHYTKDRHGQAHPAFRDILRGRIAYLEMIRGSSDPIVRRFLDQFDNLDASRPINHGIDYDPSSLMIVRAPESIGRRQLLTVMFTDIVGSTSQAVALGDLEWEKLIASHNRLIHSQLRRHRGREIKRMGDGVLAVFDSPSQAVHCGQAIVSEVKRLGIQVRVGLHTGEVQLDGDDIDGIGVAIAARVGALAKGSEVLVSQTVKELVSGSGFVFVGRGFHKLKGVPGRWRRLYKATRT